MSRWLACECMRIDVPQSHHRTIISSSCNDWSLILNVRPDNMRSIHKDYHLLTPSSDCPGSRDGQQHARYLLKAQIQCVSIPLFKASSDERQSDYELKMRTRTRLRSSYPSKRLPSYPPLILNAVSPSTMCRSPTRPTALSHLKPTMPWSYVTP